MIEIYPIESREQWLALRRRDVTASDVAAVCGLSPFKSALRVWAEKVGAVGEVADNALMRRGRWLEPGVLQAMREREPTWTIVQPKIYVRHREWRIGATPDAFAETPDGKAIVQAKTVSRPVYDEWGDEPPLGYTLQTTTERMLTDTVCGYLASLVIDTYEAHLDVFKVMPNEEAEDAIREAVDRFWHDVERGIQPRADYTQDEDLLSRLRAPKDDMEPIDLSLDNRLADVLAERSDIQRRTGEDMDRMKALNAEIIDKLRGSPIGITREWKITHKTSHREGYTVEPTTVTSLRVYKRR